MSAEIPVYLDPLVLRIAMLMPINHWGFIEQDLQKSKSCYTQYGHQSGAYIVRLIFDIGPKHENLLTLRENDYSNLLQFFFF